MEHNSQANTSGTTENKDDGPSKGSSFLTDSKVKITCLEVFDRLRKSIYLKLKEEDLLRL